MIKAIDTKYKNHLFRSRLEARYAVYFDELGVDWLYEHEGFELGNNERYLPDFYLPKYHLYAEIKPVTFTYKEHKKCKILANLTQNKVIELVGLPSLNMMTVIIPSRHFICPIHGQQYVFDDPKSLICKCSKKHQVFNTINEAEGILLLKHYKISYTPIYYSLYDLDNHNDKIITDAIRIATEARFEFNDKK
jgi:hypothetical protein